MYKPLFNTVLVEINDKEAAWGKGNDDNLGGEVFREGKVVEVGLMMPTKDYAGIPSTASFNDVVMDKAVVWNEGHEAGTVFEEDGKKYALLYWWDLRGVKNEQ